MIKITTSRYDVAEHLRTPEEMAAYLEACLEEADGDAAFVAKAWETSRGPCLNIGYLHKVRSCDADLNYSLVVEATDDPSFFGFYSPDLEGFMGVGHSIEDCLYKARWGMKSM